jgi:adenine phosphoribosyltransferase
MFHGSASGVAVAEVCYPKGQSGVIVGPATRKRSGNGLASSAAPTDLPMSSWQTLLRDVPDFPRPGILFKDITPVLADADAFSAAIGEMAAPWRGKNLDAVVGIESRGFILGAALALELGTGFVPARKPGKLPARTLSLEYALEYGSDRLHIHTDALPPGARVIVVDDVLATGGTLKAALALTRQQGAEIVGAAVLLELGFLGARKGWDDPAPLLAAAVF